MLPWNKVSDGSDRDCFSLLQKGHWVLVGIGLFWFQRTPAAGSPKWLHLRAGMTRGYVLP